MINGYDVCEDNCEGDCKNGGDGGGEDDGEGGGWGGCEDDGCGGGGYELFLVWGKDSEIDEIQAKSMLFSRGSDLTTTGCPQKKSALGKYLEIATHGFKMCILYVKRDKLGPNPSRPLIGHPWMHTISLEPFWTPQFQWK